MLRRVEVGFMSNTMIRFLKFILLVMVLTGLFFIMWILSANLLPEGIFRPYFSRLFTSRVGELTFWRVFLANLILPFLGIQFMNLFRVGKWPGGIYVLPIFWIIYGLLLGTNSFVFAEEKVSLSISVLWTRTGFSELLAYTMGYEASRSWALWEQHGLWRVKRLADRKWNPSLSDWVYWGAGLLLLVIAVMREVQV
jgi:hypothetical protein